MKRLSWPDLRRNCRLGWIGLVSVLLMNVCCTACSCGGAPAKENTSVSSSQPELEVPSSEESRKVYCQVVHVNEGSSLNIRKGPSLDAEIIGKGLPGEKFLFIREGSTEDWKKIQFEGQEGYVSSAYVSLVEE